MKGKKYESEMTNVSKCLELASLGVVHCVKNDPVVKGNYSAIRHNMFCIITNDESIFCEILETLNNFCRVSKYLFVFLFRDVTPGCNGVLQTETLHSKEVCNN